MIKLRLLSLLCVALLSACAAPPAHRTSSVIAVPVTPFPAPAPVVAPAAPEFVGEDPDTIYRTRTRASTEVLDVWFLDVGQGACTFIACPDGKSNVVIDCGTMKLNGASTPDIAAWINAKNSHATAVTLLISHGHVDHYSILPNKNIDSGYFSSVLLGGRAADYSDTFNKWLDRMPTPAIRFAPGETVANDQRFSCGAARFDLLSANATSLPNVKAIEKRQNADRAIVRVSFAGDNIILPGDAEAPTERNALDNADQLGLNLGASSLLVSSHHGASSGDSNSTPWLNRLTPQAGLFSADPTYAPYGHPTCSQLDAFGVHAAAVGLGADLSCSVNRVQKRTVAKRIFTTFDNGHVRARVSMAGITYACQVKTAACDEQLARGEMPEQ